MTIQNAKKWLSRAEKLDEEINELIKSQQRALTRATSVTCGIGDEKVQTTQKNSTEGKFINYASYSEMIDNRIDELYAIKQEILQAINKVDDGMLRTLLIARYINFGTWEHIAETIDVSEKWVRTGLHIRALEKAGEVIPLPDNF